MRRTAACLPFLLLCSSAPTTGCGACNLAGCGAGFEFVIEGVDEHDPPVAPGLPSGDYELRFEVEDGVLELTCRVQSEEIDCEPETWTEEPSAAIQALVYHGVHVHDGPLIFGRFVIYEPARHGTHHLGPTHVALEITIDGESALERAWEPEYQRLRDFNGPGCGDCDGQITERVSLPGDPL